MSDIFFKEEAHKWEEALPIGNGKMGAMIYGQVNNDLVQINEDTMWLGGPMNRSNPEAFEHLEEVRELIAQGEIAKAQELLKISFTGMPESMRMYQPGGDFFLQSDEYITNIKNYSRRLLLDKGIVEVNYIANGTKIFKEYFASVDKKVLVVHIKSDKKGALNYKAMLNRSKQFDRVWGKNDSCVMLDGKLGEYGVYYLLSAAVKTIGGNSKVVGQHIIVENADEAFFYIHESTTFEDEWKYFEEHNFELPETIEEKADYIAKEEAWKQQLHNKVFNVITNALAGDFEETKNKHISDHQKLFNRVNLDFKINDKKQEELSTKERLTALRKGKSDWGLIKTYFDFGRYLMISGSRPGSEPLNLQGIWNDNFKPAWDSKYTVNINAEMNYWPAESCNLSECHEPLFSLIRRTMERGKKIAAEMYHCRGFVVHHNTDIWGDCAPQDIWMGGTYWVMGGAWLCTHIWKHYEYTLDLEFLKCNYDVLSEAVLFFKDFLFEREGKLIVSPSVSPENTYILPNGNMGCVCENSVMDFSLLQQLMEIFIKASELLHEENELLESAKYISSKIPDFKIGKHGQLQEWQEDYDEQEPGHRHISHLYALWPYQKINMEDTPKLAKAAEITLKRRLENGGGHTGWSCAWLIAFYTHLYQGDKAFEMIEKLLKESTFDNLMDSHPYGNGGVFQIDGNLGATAAIIEMFVQTYNEKDILLPAIPKSIPDGSLTGVKLKGNRTLNITWHRGKIKTKEII